MQHEYEQLRDRLINDSSIKKKLPNFILSNVKLYEFWGYIQSEFKTYEERRTFLTDEFAPILSDLEDNNIGSPTDSSIGDTLKNLDSNEVNAIWQKAIERRSSDPEGAFTTARTLLESTIKHILDDLNQPYDDGDELPKLYKKMAKHLSLAPSEHTEPIFKQLLSGCHNVVEGVGSIRNKLSDSHGKGRSKMVLCDRHVELVVNMAGVLATFWVKTFNENTEKFRGQSTEL
ncbi:MAG: abortive infection family protein [Bdellovibrionota bacterium]